MTGMFEGKTLLITGGTGSFGRAVIRRLLNSDIKEIRVFSRDEKKQDDMRRSYRNAKIKYYIGDVRNLQALREAMVGVDYVFSAAALKQVPSCEFFPMEAVKTNILGVNNTLTAAIDAKVKKVVCLSTDKAAYPINAMGISKAMMEKIFVAKSRITNTTTICGTRYGNVMCSRGSVIPLFIDQIRQRKPLTITDPLMTRFLMSLEEAVNLVFYAYRNANAGDLMIMKAPAATIGTLAQAIKELFRSDVPVQYIGIRHGEKKDETLLTQEECLHAEDMGDFFRIAADNRDLHYDRYFEEGHKDSRPLAPFTSENALRLNVEQVKRKLLGLSYVKNALDEMGVGNAACLPGEKISR